MMVIFVLLINVILLSVVLLQKFQIVASECPTIDLCFPRECNPVDGDQCITHEINCTTNDPCLKSRCNAGVCVFDNICCPAECEDVNKCVTKSCGAETNYTCIQTPIDCDDKNSCTLNSCDPITGCVNPPVDCDHITGCYHTKIPGCRECTPSECQTIDLCFPRECNPVAGDKCITHVVNIQKHYFQL